MPDKDSLTDWVKTLITDYVNNSADNRMGGGYAEKAWGNPLIGFSSGDDPLYSTFKQDIGDFLWTPLEIFTKTFPEASNVKDNELSVICWALPQAAATKQDMRNARLFPAHRAALSRLSSDHINKELAKHLIGTLNENGYQAVAPGQSPYWENKTSVKYGFASSWSERHAAYISGLGTFSLSDTLITERGTAVRLGSVIARMTLTPTERKYTDYREYCLHSTSGGCGVCMKRCPAGAITDKGHDKMKCRQYQREVTSKYLRENFNITAGYCGLCQFDIPCESCIPNK
jgi:epoxyqueuosine reductase QueG